MIGERTWSHLVYFDLAMSMENPFAKKPEKLKTLAENILESLEKDPYSYRSLRKSVDEGKMTKDEAEEILKKWKEVIEKQELKYKNDPANAREIRQIQAEKVISRSKYPETYKVKDLDEQFEYLFGTLNLSGLVEMQSNLNENLQVQELKRSLEIDGANPGKLDGIFYIPPMYLVAEAARQQHLQETQDKPDEEVAVWYVLKRLKETREELIEVKDEKTGEVTKKLKLGLPSFYQYLEGLSSKSLRLHPRAALAHAKNELYSRVEGLTFLPLQSGLTHKGESPRHTLNNLQTLKGADEQSFREVPLDLYSAACLMLTHPERASQKNLNLDLYIWAAGSQMAPYAGAAFGYVPLFCCYRDELRLRNHSPDTVDGSYGVASALVSK